MSPNERASKPTQSQGWDIFTPAGDFDAQTVRDLRPRFEDMASADNGDLIFDMSSVNFIDSSGVGALVFLFKRLSVKNRRMALAGVKGQPAEVLKLLGLDKAIPTAPVADVPANCGSLSPVAAQ